MVKLVVDDLEQMTILEYMLQANRIKYERTLDDCRFGIPTPYLLVYGVPLDEERAMKWIDYTQEELICE